MNTSQGAKGGASSPPGHRISSIDIKENMLIVMFGATAKVVIDTGNGLLSEENSHCIPLLFDV